MYALPQVCEFQDVCCQCGRLVTNANLHIEKQNKALRQAAIGLKCGTTEEQQEGGKAKEVLREARRQTCAPFLERWQNDDVYRASQVGKLVGQKKKVRRMEECALLTTVIKLRGKNWSGTDKLGLTEEILVEPRNKTRIHII